MIRSSSQFILFGVLFLAVSACQLSTDQLPLTAQTITSQQAVQATATSASAKKPEETARPQATETLSPSSPTPTASPLPPSPTPTQLHPSPAPAISFPDPAAFEWSLFTSGLSRPVGIVHAGDGSGRLFILEQAGVIRTIQNDQLLPEPFLDISGRVTCCSERGLLGLAFHPNFEQNGFFYINYTDLNGNTVIARFQVIAGEDRGNPNSEIRLLEIGQPFRNHNGGGMAFGPDGYLYLGLGDGGSQGDPLGNAQNRDVLLGKLLRVDVGEGDFYSIPADNPFTQGGGAPEVWAYGLRNPWRFSFDRLTGDLYIGDVGQGTWEEIDYLPAGSPGGTNFGWNYLEGMHAFSNLPQPEGEVLTDPVAEYSHNQGISVIGGVVYRGEQLPSMQGIYLFGDYGSGLIWGLFMDDVGTWQNAILFRIGGSITSFGEDESGEIYVADLSGHIFRLISR